MNRMKEVWMTLRENRPLTDTVWRMELTGDTGAITAPGQFVNIQLEGFFLRRPISVCDWEEGKLTLIYKIVGGGTERMAGLAQGTKLNLLTGLGNGFDLSRAGACPLLLGGGVGVPPLYGLARRLREAGRPVTAVLGFNTGREVFFEREFRALGCDTVVTTMDGSRGTRGFVTDAMPANSSFFYACGPMPMLRAVALKTETDGQISMEERMGCGFGACMGCSVRTKTGWKRICREGPVLGKEENLWEG